MAYSLALFKTKRKLKYFLTPLGVVSIIFILYQLIIFSQLNSMNTNSKKKTSKKLLGTNLMQQNLYLSTEDNKFKCIFSGELIDFEMINDDYCDCEDGSDEPGTNACANMTFFCTSQASHSLFKNVISSNKVNDGICDCCDGSDEYLGKELSFRLNDVKQKSYNKYMSPCPNLCPDLDE